MKQDRSVVRWLFQIFSTFAIALSIIYLGQKNLTVFADKLTENAQPVDIQTPTILVPGTNGTVDRFDNLIKALNINEHSDVLKVTVATDGTVSFKGSLSNKSEHPIIVIAFEDSSDDMLAAQGRWYQQALLSIQQRYIFEKYNYLGHSNGGLVITSYLENCQEMEEPQLDKLMTLGTPYNDTSSKYNELVTVFTQVKRISNTLTTYSENLDKIPSTVKMLNIAGEVGNSASDGTVPVQSVFSGRLIYQERVAEYQEILIQGKNTSHSSLVENTEVIDQLKRFFWSQ